MPCVSIIEKIYDQAIAIQDPRERTNFIRQACKDNETLRRQVEALFINHADSESESSSTSNLFDRDNMNYGIGSMIGPYRLVREIGEGGFGMVFEAEQTSPVRRTVALKILKPGMNATQIVRRFQQEQQALAVMDHPHIARVFDAGTADSGVPFFVMERVQGIPVSAFCDEHLLSFSDRLILFTKVCRAVQHAHQKGIIHRDLKPSNILVSNGDTGPAPKIIDFGIAKALAPDESMVAAQTLWHQFLGTPAYMSPEQCRAGELDVDTRSDIYALGVLLYELLNGAPPLDLTAVRDPDEARRRIREDEAPRPSTRWQQLEETDRTRLAAQRNSEPREVLRKLRGDLDWIALRATAKERDRRYESAESLARDVERFLAHQPIEARPPSVGYRCRRFVRRNRVMVAAASAVVVALLGGLIAAGWGLHMAREESEVARAQSSKAQQMNDILFLGLLRADPGQGRGKDYSVRELIDDLGHDVDGRKDMTPDVESSIRDMLSYIYWQTGDYQKALHHGQRGLAVAETFDEDPKRLASMEMTVGEAFKELNQYEDAARHMTRCLEFRVQMFGAAHPQVNRTKVSVARIQYHAGDRADALLLCEDALREARKNAPGSWGNTPLIRALNMMEILLKDEGRLEEAVALNHERMAIVVNDDGELHPEAVRTRGQLGGLLTSLNRLDEAHALLSTTLTDARAKLGNAYPVTVEIIVALARCQTQRGEIDAAAELFDEAILLSSLPERVDRILLAIEFNERHGRTTRADELRAELVGKVMLE